MNVMAFIQGMIMTFLAGLALTLAFLMLTGRICLHGLLRDKWDGSISPGRIQALVATIAGGCGYLVSALAHAGTGSLPPVPGELLAVLGASNGLYLAGKFNSLLQRRFNFNRST